ncbi:MAG: hypothetical protein MT334_04930 [Candidatus Nitrosopumilus limneticus]|nr:conserved exported protein of unknown function [Candidatus Nitrosopumilus limneticus]MDA0668756.1 hypothetical protein [Thermoproteota archaeon]HJJ21139.1 hypothetical protein [Nitrosopumilus sp.]MDA0853854.1 hypothetical protein [Thermoproteota archaeon]MDA1122756.1 hypothetical protein [Thermoproteota archaeon]
MKTILFLFSILILFSLSPTVQAHKLISHDDSHRDYDSALVIPDHKISWAIYENLGVSETKFYTFDAKKGDSFYASIVIPKLEGLENYSPSLVLMNDDIFTGNSKSTDIQSNIQKFLYEGDYPGNEFYEPFGQVTYWERQEVKSIIPADGQYFILVLDEKNQSGKYSLAIGTIEDFSGADFFTILPKAWLDTKLFLNDYVSIVIAISMLIGIPSLLFVIVLRKRIFKK